MDDENYLNTSNDEDNAVDAYKQSLSELVMNSKPHIMMLTMLADELKDTKASKIVDCIEQRLFTVSNNIKLPTLYLIDSIIKNVKNSSYLQLFQKRIVKLFYHVFEKSEDEKQRILLYKLRQTWNEFFNQDVLYQLDISIKQLDSGWPIVAKKPSSSLSTDNQQHQQSQQKSISKDTITTTTKHILVPVQKIQTISTQPPVSKPIETANKLVMNSDQQPSTTQRIVFNSKNYLDKTKSIISSSTSTTTTSTKAAGTLHPTIIHLNQVDILTKRNQIENELRKELINKANTVASAVNHNNINHNNDNKINQTSNISKNSNKIPNNNNNKLEQQKLTKKQKQQQKKNNNQSSTKLAPTIEHIRDLDSNNKMMLPSSSSSNKINDNTNKNKKIKQMKIPKRKRQLSPDKSSSSSSSNKHPKKSPLDEILAPPPDDIIPLGSNHHIAVAKRAKEIRKPNNNVVSAKVKMIKNRRQSSPTPISSASLSSAAATTSTIQSRNRNQQSAPSIKPNRDRGPISSFVTDTKKSNNNTNQIPISSSTIQPTVLPAPNIFSQPEVLFNNTTTTTSSFDYNNDSNQSNNFVMDRDYRREYDAFMNDARNRLNAGAITSADHAILVREAEREFFQLQQQQQQQLPPPPPVVPASMPPVSQSFSNAPFENSQIISLPQQQQQPSTVTTSAVANPAFLEPPYGSSALFINKQFCRLFYLDPITGIVPFKAHADTPFDQLVSTDPMFLEPKQVYFSGHPTTVIIDPGTTSEQSLCLNFNSPTPSYFHLPGVPHPQRIMLGLPDRELIVNDRPYKAQFGGGPVPIYFESDLQTHMFLLSDSKPFLQVSDEPRYDLWNRLVEEAKAKMMHQQPQQIPPQSTANIPFNYNQSIILPQQTAIMPTTVPTTITYHQPSVSAPIISESLPSSSSISTKPALPDLDSLLSKLSAAGLISAKATLPVTSAATTSTTTISTKDSNENKNIEKLPPKQYLPLEMSKLKQYHQFAIDQLYQGLQCTNCSLRFTNDCDTGKKSRYARHLDWHFRQNRREKMKPEFGSAAAAQRRPFYYTIEQWILYKEVNDDIEENNNMAFFDSNSVDSPSSSAHRANQFSANFAPFKDFISEFDSFIEAISCDNINVISTFEEDKNKDNKICSVVAESDMTINCTVCNEPFKIEWFEDEEEWRLINAVRYSDTDTNDEHTSNVGRHFHPLCLKDYLLQQLEKQSLQNSDLFEQSDQNLSLDISMDNKPLIPVSSSNSIIPGLDMPIKDEDDDKEPIVKNEIIEQTPQPSTADNVKNDIEMSDDANDDEQNDKTVEEENMQQESFEVKVEEFEITIETIAPSSTTIADKTENENIEIKSSIDDVKADDEVNKDGDPDHQPQQSSLSSTTIESKPKRPLIVLKMKSSSNSTAATTTNDDKSTIGNVSVATNDNINDNYRNNGHDNDDVDQNESSKIDNHNKDTKIGDEQSENCDDSNKTNIDDDDDNSNNNTNNNNKINDDKNELLSLSDDNNINHIDSATTTTTAANIGDVHDDDNSSDKGNQQKSVDSLNIKVENDCIDSLESIQQSTINESNNEKSMKIIDTETSKNDNEIKINYYSRGKEVSSLCNIM